MKKKWTGKDIFFMLALTITLVMAACYLKKDGYLLGSTVDWESQHFYFPEYFRALFYETKNVLPSFAFHIGAGQNIYNFAYYGLLSPIILLSYLLPKVPMADYVAYSTLASILISALLLYRFLRHYEKNELICFFAAFLFLSATPLLFHLHRHIMFINYMPFLILGLFGVDLYFDHQKGWLLTCSVFLMIMTSFYYSVCGIIALILYGVYRYLKKTKKVTIANFFQVGFRFLLPIIIGVFLAGIIILPTFYVILSGRGATTVSTTIKDALIPGFYLNYVLYKSYGVGLSAVAILSVIHLVFKKEKEYVFLGVALALAFILPLVNYALNATMYIDAKILIPLLPIYIFAIFIFTKDLFQGELNFKVEILIFAIVVLAGAHTLGEFKIGVLIDLLITTIAVLSYLWKRNPYFYMIPCMAISLGVSYVISINDSFVEEDAVFGSKMQSQKDLISSVTEQDHTMYRIANQISPSMNVNRIFENLRYYQTTLYSSTYNKKYNEFYYDTMNNAVQSRNRVIVSAPRNPLFLMAMGQKYYIDDGRDLIGYQKINKADSYEVYRNDDVLPIGYASSHLLNEAAFKELNYPYNQESILNNIIVKDAKSKETAHHIKPYDLALKEKDFQALNIEKKDNYYLLRAEKRTKVTIDLPEPLQQKYLFLRFDILESMSCSEGDLYITINGITNKLTCKEWKYHNKNYTFDYVIGTNEIDKLQIAFSQGTFKINNIQAYTLAYEAIKNSNKQVDPFQFDLEKTKGDKIVGDIQVSEDGYFMLTIPYDKGFTFLVDGKEIPYEKVNTAFIGIPITKGNHHIEVTYASPYKNVGLAFSGIGLLGFAIQTIVERKKRLS